MKVEQVMKHDVKACRPHDFLNKAAQLMWENACGCVPVVDEHNKPLGILTDRDICMAAYTQGKSLADMRADSAMARKPVCCRSEDEISAAMNLMREKGTRRLPVVDARGGLVGILSLDDLACESRRVMRGAVYEELGRLVGDVFSSICVNRAQNRAPH